MLSLSNTLHVYCDVPWIREQCRSGHTVRDQKEPTPFVIEWIPDILPLSHIGELRLKFEYGHLRNGHLDNRTDS